ncbi:MAG: hypothetical protein IKW48_03385 [Akkermansia sp.]|nr:hypothetical protein [Akkermansia sp.]
MPTFRILRCANAQLYIAAAILMIGAAVYVLCCKDALWQQIAAVAAAIITPAWAAHYAILRFTVDAAGITRRSMRGSTCIKWAELSSATLQECHNQGTASCTIHLQAGEQKMSISSDLLPLDDVQELAKELRESGLLH